MSESHQSERLSRRIAFPQRRPILFSVVLLLVILVIYFLAGAITFQLKLPPVTISIIGDTALALIAILLLSRLHWWQEAGFRLPLKPHSLWFFLIPCLPVGFNAFSGIGYPGMARLLLFLALALVVGFVEEAFFRGMILRALVVRGPWQAVLISSFFFGIAHLFNLAAGANLGATLLQVGYALAIGLMYAALALRTRTILPLIILHGLTDFFGFLALNSTVVTTSVNTLVLLLTAGEIVIYTVYSFWLMRQVKSQMLSTKRETTTSPISAPV